MENDFYQQIQEHLRRLVPPRPREIAKMEMYANSRQFPIIGPAAGYLCYQMARMIGAKRIFELGSGFGYSTAWFAKAVKENGGGTVYHVVWDEGLSKKAQVHLKKLRFADIVQYQVGEAIEALRQAEGPFDLIFNDIDKKDYPQSLPVIKEKLRSGGVLITDNIIWSGRIFDSSDRSVDTEGVRDFTRLIVNDPNWITSVIPIRDGLIVAYKK